MNERTAWIGGRRWDDLAGLARRVVALGITVCAPVLVGIWITDERSDPWVRWGYPPLSALLLVFAWVLLNRPRIAARAAIVCLVLLESWWLSVILGRISEAPDAAAAWMSLLPTPLLDVLVCLMVGYLFQSTRTALLHGTAYATLVTATMAAAFWRIPGGRDYLWETARFGVYLLVALVLLLALSRAKERAATAVAAAARADARASQLRELAYRDELTGIANRRRLIEELSHQAALVGPEHSVSIVYFDLDHFKHVNDTRGHDIGDKALVIVADIARSAVRETDLLARLGGEEFVIVSPGTTRDQAVQLAERLRQAVPSGLGATLGIPITASFGIAELEPGEQAASALRRVDELMYRAKADGRNRVESGEG